MLEIQLKTSFHEKTTLCLSDIVRSELRKKHQSCTITSVLRSVVLTSDQAFHGTAILETETSDITEVFEIQSSYILSKISDIQLSHKCWHALTLKAGEVLQGDTIPYHIIIKLAFEPLLAEDPT
jgi:hypothetical protein